MAALFLALGLIINLAVHGWLGAILEAAALFLALAIAVNLAVYGWLGAIGAWWSATEAHAGNRQQVGAPPYRRHLHGTGSGFLVRPLFRGSPVRVARNFSKVQTSENT